MGFWDWLTTGGSAYPEVKTGVDPMAGVREPWYGETEQWYAEPSYRPLGGTKDMMGRSLGIPEARLWGSDDERKFYEDAAKGGWKDSLWGALKFVSTLGAKVAGSYLGMRKGGDPGALGFNLGGGDDREVEDYRYFTEHQRGNSGSGGERVVIGGGGAGGLGIPPMFLLAGVALLLFMRKKGKK